MSSSRSFFTSGNPPVVLQTWDATFETKPRLGVRFSGAFHCHSQPPSGGRDLSSVGDTTPRQAQAVGVSAFDGADGARFCSVGKFGRSRQGGEQQEDQRGGSFQETEKTSLADFRMDDGLDFGSSGRYEEASLRILEGLSLGWAGRNDVLGEEHFRHPESNCQGGFAADGVGLCKIAGGHAGGTGNSSSHCGGGGHGGQGGTDPGGSSHRESPFEKSVAGRSSLWVQKF